MTILHTVCAVDAKSILHAVEEMEEQLRGALSAEIEQIGILGVSEVEIVNLGLYGGKDTKDEMRKGQGLRALAQAAGLEIAGKEHLALVHFHGIVDFGPNTWRSWRKNPRSIAAGLAGIMVRGAQTLVRSAFDKKEPEESCRVFDEGRQ